MHNYRIIGLGDDLNNHIFEILNAEPELTGMDAGKVAAAVEEAFLKTLRSIFQNDKPDRIANDLDRATTHIEQISKNGWERS